MVMADGAIVRMKVTRVAAFVLLLVGASTARYGANQTYERSEQYESVYYVPAAKWLRLLSIGYVEALADLLWMRGLVYYGEEITHRKAVRHIGAYADGILALDPDFKSVYSWVSMGLLYVNTSESSSSTISRARAARDYMRRAYQRYPDDGNIAWELGALLRFELPGILKDPVEIDSAKREGLNYLQIAARKGAGPPWLSLSNATELKKLGQTEQAIRHLTELYATVNDNETRAEIRSQLSKLKQSSWVESTERVLRALHSNHQRDFPYIDEALYIMLGERIQN